MLIRLVVQKDGLQVALERTDVALCLWHLVHHPHVLGHRGLAANLVLALLALQLRQSEELLCLVKAKDVFQVVVQGVPEVSGFLCNQNIRLKFTLW